MAILSALWYKFAEHTIVLGAIETVLSPSTFGEQASNGALPPLSYQLNFSVKFYATSAHPKLRVIT